MSLDWSSGALAEGLECYRSARFFDAHEHWEGVWLRTAEPEKSFLQAVIQITAAFHHMERGNRTGAASLLRRAHKRLSHCPAVFGGIEVDLLREEVTEWLREIDSGSTGDIASRPRIYPIGARPE